MKKERTRECNDVGTKGFESTYFSLYMFFRETNPWLHSKV